jgi:hypothetical protein
LPWGSGDVDASKQEQCDKLLDEGGGVRWTQFQPPRCVPWMSRLSHGTFWDKQQAEPEILRPNFGQHTCAIDELLKRLSETIRYRDALQKRTDEDRDRLHEQEQRLIGYNRAIESYRGAIRALGGKVPDDGSAG